LHHRAHAADSEGIPPTSVARGVMTSTRTPFRGWTTRKKMVGLRTLKHKRNEEHGRATSAGDSSCSRSLRTDVDADPSLFGGRRSSSTSARADEQTKQSPKGRRARRQERIPRWPSNGGRPMVSYCARLFRVFFDALQVQSGQASVRSSPQPVDNLWSPSHGCGG